MGKGVADASIIQDLKDSDRQSEKKGKAVEGGVKVKKGGVGTMKRHIIEFCSRVREREQQQGRERCEAERRG